MIRASHIPNKVFRHIAKGTFKNRHGVVFEAEDYISLCAGKQIDSIPETAKLDIEFFADKKAFTDTLNITTVRDLYSIDQATLETLYLQGKAEIVCEVNLAYTHVLVFKLVAGKIIAQDDIRTEHPVEAELKATIDFINYTIGYYKSHEQQHLRIV